MKNFVDTSILFQLGAFDVSKDGVKLFYVTSRECLKNKEIFEPIFCADIEPAVKQKHLEDLVQRLRPELAGCRVGAFEFAFACLQWKICVVHESLPRYEHGNELESEPLLKRSGFTGDVVYHRNLGAKPNEIIRKDESGVWIDEENVKCGDLTKLTGDYSHAGFFELKKDESWRDREPLL